MSTASLNLTVAKARRSPRNLWRELRYAVRRPIRGTFHPGIGSIEPEAVSLLNRMVVESRKYPGPIVEIGTLFGVTTTTMALAKAPEQKIVTVDLYCWNPWGFTPEVHQRLADQMLRYLIQTGQVERIKMDKDEFYRTYEGPAPSMVFLDAIHDYEATKADIEWAKKADAKIIAGHDYCDLFPGVIRAVDEFGGPRERAASVWRL
ncbi:MAG TPA: class I SAM-dependent methyltransferase [Lacipirellulaceae bacterium]|jgi:predicted O-methyltransferase YrrM|nr:class I SAM-dependent methyltransferase [Lacipirellulaceae bacterium]